MDGATAGFISKGSFLQKVQQRKEEDTILHWSDLSENGEIYRINDIEDKEGKFGPCHILHIQNDQGEKKKVWSPSKLIRDIQDKKETHIVYFTSLGQSFKKGKTYNNFDLAFQEKRN